MGKDWFRGRNWVRPKDCVIFSIGSIRHRYWVRVGIIRPGVGIESGVGLG